jgi:hypothetical protein
VVRALLETEIATPGPGQCILHNMNGQLWLERADPVVAIAEALVTQVRAGTGHPDISLDGKTLVINTANRQVSYRLERCAQPGYLLGTLT